MFSREGFSLLLPLVVVWDGVLVPPQGLGPRWLVLELQGRGFVPGRRGRGLRYAGGVVRVVIRRVVPIPDFRLRLIAVLFRSGGIRVYPGHRSHRRPHHVDRARVGLAGVGRVVDEVIIAGWVVRADVVEGGVVGSSLVDLAHLGLPVEGVGVAEFADEGRVLGTFVLGLWNEETNGG